MRVPDSLTVHLHKHPTSAVCLREPHVVQTFLQPGLATEGVTPLQMVATFVDADTQEHQLTLRHLPTYNPTATTADDPNFTAWRSVVQFHPTDVGRLRGASRKLVVGKIDLTWHQEVL